MLAVPALHPQDLDGSRGQRAGRLSPLQNLSAGLVARALVGTLLLPVAVVKVRYESNMYRYPHVWTAFASIARQEGLRGLYSGLTATLLRDAPFSGLYVLFYEQFRHVAFDHLNLADGPLTNFSCGVSAGFVSTLITQPADMVKTRVQLQPSKYGHFLRASGIIYREGGGLGFFRGMLPRCFRKTCSSAVTWTVYEEVLRAYVHLAR